MRTGTEPAAGSTIGAAATVALARRPSAESATAVAGLPRRSPGLGTKFSLAAALLLLVTLAGALSIVTVRANLVARRSIREDLSRAPLIYRTFQSDLEARLRDIVRSLAGEPGTKALFDPGVSQSTHHDFVATDASAILGARTVFLFDPRARVLARSDRPEGQGVGVSFAGVKWVTGPLETLHEASAAILEGETLSIVAAAPVVSGEGEATHLDGVLAASFPLERTQVMALQGLTRGEEAFLVNRARRGAPPDPVVSSSTDGFHPQEFASAFRAVPGAADAVFEKGQVFGPFELSVAGSRRIGVAVPVKSATGETYGAFVAARSLADEMAAFNQIRLTLFLVGGLAVLIAVPAAFALGRRIAAPLEQLAAGAAGIREGDLEVELPRSGRDEVGVLAQAFREMVVELKEKRALEELVRGLQKPLGSQITVGAAQAGPGVATGSGPRAGEVFGGRYRVRSILGTGAMGSVYLVEDLQLEEDVALKVIKAKALVLAGTSSIQNLKTEIRLARKITHPNVVRVHDLGEADGVAFLTMEYVPGMTLRHVISRQGTVALAPGLQIAKQLCRGLAAVHGAGIIHRDIKPQNIMVLPSGVVKLMDFGIASVERGGATTATGEIVGTPSYMSPEQARGMAVDPRSDLYAVGAVLFETFTGAQPFEGDPLEVIRQHVHEPPPRPSELRPELPASVEALILACLAKDPAQRPQSAQDLYASLMRVELSET